MTKKYVKESWSTAELHVNLHSEKAEGNKKEVPPSCSLTCAVKLKEGQDITPIQWKCVNNKRLIEALKEDKGVDVIGHRNVPYLNTCVFTHIYDFL